MQTFQWCFVNPDVLSEVGSCAATILLAIALAPQLFLDGYAEAYTASILAILSAILQAQFKYG